MKKCLFFFFCLLFCLHFSCPARAYALFTHQAVVDVCWKKTFVPALKAKYPEASNSQLRQAKAYAYGGAIIQDMGYYPLGSQFFTDLLHYVRSGTFVENLLEEAGNVDEYAFALGALSHYYADIYGHSLGANRSMPIMYPKIRKHFGKVATYEDDPANHTRMEFSFDIFQAARGKYTPEAYRDYIGFKVAQPLLERAFLKTYGIKISEIYIYLPLSISVFRVTVRGLLPEFAKIGWNIHRKQIHSQPDTLPHPDMLDSMQSDGFREMYAQNDGPGASARALTLFFRVIPKVGPASAMKLKIPNSEAESFFIRSFYVVVNKYRAALRKLISNIALGLPDINLDTGEPTRTNEYYLADESHRKLLKCLHKNHFCHVSGSLQQYLLNFYSVIPVPPDYRKEKKENCELRRDLVELRRLHAH